MAKRNSYSYAGVLNQPIYIPLYIQYLRNPADEELAKKAIDRLREARAERFFALCAECGVKPDDDAAGWQVALTLAERHIPGFKVCDRKPAKRGRAVTWVNVTDDFVILAEMQSRVDDGQSIRAAAGHVKKALKRSESAAALDRKYRRLRKAIPGTTNSYWFSARVSLDIVKRAAAEGRSVRLTTPLGQPDD